jgi:nucleoid DNA-binding protein
MEGKVLLQDLGEALSHHNHLSKKDGENFVRTFFEVLVASLKEEKVVKVKGLGVFKLVSVSSRESVNVSTGERFEIQSHTKVSFTPDAGLADLINRPFAQFETVVLSDDADLALMESISDISEGEAVGDAEGDVEDDSESSQLKDSLLSEDEPGTDSAQAVPIVGSQSAFNADKVEAGEENTDDKLVEEDDVVSKGQDTTAEHVSGLEETTDQPVEDNVEIPTASVPDSDSESHSQASASATDAKDVDEGTEKSGDELSEPIEWKRAIDQEVETQVISHQTVKEQTVEHQTIEHQHVVVSRDNDSFHHHKSGRRGFAARFILWSILALLLMAGAYFIGYYGILNPERKWSNLPKPEVEPAVSVSAPKQENADLTAGGQQDKGNSDVVNPKAGSEKKQTVSAPEQGKPEIVENKALDVDSKCTMAEKAEAVKKYPQKTNGKYLIVGTLRTHVVKRGESLYHLAKDVYGEKSFASYIIVYNHISNPDHVEVGTLLKLPSLKSR